MYLQYSHSTIACCSVKLATVRVRVRVETREIVASTTMKLDNNTEQPSQCSKFTIITIDSLPVDDIRKCQDQNIQRLEGERYSANVYFRAYMLTNTPIIYGRQWTTSTILLCDNGKAVNGAQTLYLFSLTVDYNNMASTRNTFKENLTASQK